MINYIRVTDSYIRGVHHRWDLGPQVLKRWLVPWAPLPKGQQQHGRRTAGILRSGRLCQCRLAKEPWPVRNAPALNHDPP